MSTILALGAHPDDLEIFCGGALACLADQGERVVGCIATRGEKGTRRAEADPEELARLRRKEAEEGARRLGLADLVWLGFPDGELDRRQPELRQQLVALIRRCRPQAMFVFDPWRRYEFHPDHRTLGLAACDARLAAKLPLYFPEQLAVGLTLWDTPELYLYNTDQPDSWVGVDRTFERKLEAVAAHRSQFSPDELRSLTETLCEDARGYGARAGESYAEAFRRFAFGDLLVFHSLTQGRGGART